MSTHPYGLVLGRFQPIHIGHMEFLEAAKRRCDRLIVGVTNPDIRAMAFHAADPNRSKEGNNPFTFFQRLEMIESALLGVGWKPADFSILPADIADDEAMLALPGLLPDAARTIYLATIYDPWGEEKVSRMKNLGFNVEVLWRRSMAERVTSGTEVRRLMVSGGAWRHLVPAGVSQFAGAEAVALR